MTADDWAVLMAQATAQNIAEGKCPRCGGAGLVSDMRAIERTNNPHATKRCAACKGSGRHDGAR